MAKGGGAEVFRASAPPPVQQPAGSKAPKPALDDDEEGMETFAGFPAHAAPDGIQKDAWVMASAKGAAAQVLLEDFLWKKKRWAGPLVLGPQPQVAASAITEALACRAGGDGGAWGWRSLAEVQRKRGRVRAGASATLEFSGRIRPGASAALSKSGKHLVPFARRPEQVQQSRAQLSSDVAFASSAPCRRLAAHPSDLCGAVGDACKTKK
eukprot:CAMPEP_0175253316 /NCGR_PEP_ID=MMETSP0093-20121207/36623_1 /TAXON_ID=311494 /ORGANISM="Alexandrium monilatum, Strain CCMP3105" /LENGTH=209 /DNA_ID=CAMNT_0016547623 /DNA_START=57 /DNA_END=684 /DNA_ORIENTATION=+